MEYTWCNGGKSRHWLAVIIRTAILYDLATWVLSETGGGWRDGGSWWYDDSVNSSTTSCVHMCVCHIRRDTHIWPLYSADPLEDQATSTMTWNPTRSQYPYTEPTSPCLILVMQSIWLGSDKNQFLSRWFESTRVWIIVFESFWLHISESAH